MRASPEIESVAGKIEAAGKQPPLGERLPGLRSGVVSEGVPERAMAGGNAGFAGAKTGNPRYLCVLQVPSLV
ncbi:hypothetical protein LCGC14_0022660 [marine sediment metagenome]|uniref:Uncharacterized protein n=1 Tax=marine sediment metagenome TaxID=412755 RepID=A0A0F9WEE7_9ZZZZ